MVLQGVECYWLAIFLILTIVIFRIAKLCQVFLWSSKNPFLFVMSYAF